MPIYEQSLNVRKMSPVWWYATWRILASYVGIAAGPTACRIAEIGNLWYKFSPKGYIPLRDFYKIWRWGGSPRSAVTRNFAIVAFKMWAQSSQNRQNGNFLYKFAQKGYTPLSYLYRILLGEGFPGLHPHTKFYRFAFKNVGLQPKIAKIGNFWYIFGQKRYPLNQFLQNLASGGSPMSSQSRQLSPLWL